MSQTTLNLVAVTIFISVMSALLGPFLHISPAVTAIAILGILGIATIDTLSLQGQIGTLVTDWFDNRSDQYRQRVLHHEAGHFLAAHLLGIPVTGYTLTAWEAFRSGQPGRGGVTFDDRKLEAELQQGQLSSRLVDQYCKVWMAGIAAENLVYGNAEGGIDDRQKFRILWQQMSRPIQESILKERWSMVQARSLLEKYQDAYKALVTAMANGEPVEECCKIIDQHSGCTEQPSEQWSAELEN